jgi:hypothetical protein
MAIQVKIDATGKVALTDTFADSVGRLVVHIPADATISVSFVGRPRHDPGHPDQLTASDDVTLGYYTPISDTLATAAVSSGQVHVKADGNLVYANVASVTGTVYLTCVPIRG